jgi:hypothetical protein
MDPLSFTASLIAVSGLLGTITKTLRKVQNVYHATRDINVLANEISDLQAVFQNVELAVQERQHVGTPQQHTFPNLATNVQAAKDKLQELDTILKDRLIKASSVDGVIKVDRMQWLKQQSHIVRIQSELRTIRRNLMTQISALHSYVEYPPLNLLSSICSIRYKY